MILECFGQLKPPELQEVCSLGISSSLFFLTTSLPGFVSWSLPWWSPRGRYSSWSCLKWVHLPGPLVLRSACLASILTMLCLLLRNFLMEFFPLTKYSLYRLSWPMSTPRTFTCHCVLLLDHLVAHLHIQVLSSSGPGPDQVQVRKVRIWPELYSIFGFHPPPTRPPTRNFFFALEGSRHVRWT